MTTHLSVPEVSSKIIASLSELQIDDFMHHCGLRLLGKSGMDGANDANVVQMADF
jgi:hypothetical protein